MTKKTTIVDMSKIESQTTSNWRNSTLLVVAVLFATVIGAVAFANLTLYFLEGK